MKKVCISKYRSESATSDRPKQYGLERGLRLAALAAAIRTREASGEAIGFDPQRHILRAEGVTIKVVMSVV